MLAWRNVKPPDGSLHLWTLLFPSPLVTVTVGGKQHLLGLYDTAGQVRFSYFDSLRAWEWGEKSIWLGIWGLTVQTLLLLIIWDKFIVHLNDNKRHILNIIKTFIITQQKLTKKKNITWGVDRQITIRWLMIINNQNNVVGQESQFLPTDTNAWFRIKESIFYILVSLIFFSCYILCPAFIWIA